MRRALREMGAIEWVIWIIECIPGALVISLPLTIAASIVFDFSLAAEGWLAFVAQFIPGAVVGLAIMMAIGWFFGSLLLGMTRFLGLRRD